MSIGIPLTAGTDITNANVSATASQTSSITTASTEASSPYGGFAGDIVSLSDDARNAQLNNGESSSKQAEAMEKEAVSVSSSIGRASSAGNLTLEQATKLYNEISAMI